MGWGCGMRDEEEVWGVVCVSMVDEEGRHTRPADIRVQNWESGKLAVLDFTITSLLNPPSTKMKQVGSAAWLLKPQTCHH